MNHFIFGISEIKAAVAIDHGRRVPDGAHSLRVKSPIQLSVRIETQDVVAFIIIKEQVSPVVHTEDRWGIGRCRRMSASGRYRGEILEMAVINLHPPIAVITDVDFQTVSGIHIERFVELIVSEPEITQRIDPPAEGIELHNPVPVCLHNEKKTCWCSRYCRSMIQPGDQRL